jgi:hypothetical protein
MKHPFGILLCLAACAAVPLTACRSEAPLPAKEKAPRIDPELGTLSIPGPTDARANALLEEAYALKQVGRNGAALAAIEKACGIVERTAGKAAAEYGSCLDDEASVHVRMGHVDTARGLFAQALDILGKAKGADPRLVHGVKLRAEELELMVREGITCDEAAEPQPDAGVAVPYFPDIGAVQNALGTLNPYVAICSDGAPEAVTVRIILTGDGRAIRAETRGLQADTPLGNCVLEKLMAAIPKAKIPPFRACFRGFTYPFMVGVHESRQAP